MINTLGQCIYHNVQSSLNLTGTPQNFPTNIKPMLATSQPYPYRGRDSDSSGGTQRKAGSGLQL